MGDNKHLSVLFDQGIDFHTSAFQCVNACSFAFVDFDFYYLPFWPSQFECVISHKA